MKLLRTVVCPDIEHDEISISTSPKINHSSLYHLYCPWTKAVSEAFCVFLEPHLNFQRI